MRRAAARGVISTGGAREGPGTSLAVAVIGGEKVEIWETREELPWSSSGCECECSRQKDSYVRPELADGGDCVADVGCGYA